MTALWVHGEHSFIGDSLPDDLIEQVMEDLDEGMPHDLIAVGVVAFYEADGDPIDDEEAAAMVECIAEYCGDR